MASSFDSGGPSGCSSGFTDEPDPRGAINENYQRVR